MRFSVSFLLVASFLSSQVFYESVFLLAPSSRIYPRRAAPPSEVKSVKLLPGEFLGSDLPRAVGIGGIGIKVPSLFLTNQGLVEAAAGMRDRLITSQIPYDEARHYNPDDFGKKGTGIVSRYWMDPSENIPSQMAAEALKEALERAGFPVDKIVPALRPWLIGVATYGAELLSPGIAPLVNRHLGIPFPFPSLSADAVCPGWIAAVIPMAAIVGSGMAHLGMIPILEWYSPHLRPDSSAWPLFGDMAAATVLLPAEKGYGILWGMYQTDGKEKDIKKKIQGNPIGKVILADIIHTPHEGFFTMHGQAVGAMAMEAGLLMVHRATEILKQTGIGRGLDDIDWFVFHQANKGLILELADKLGIPQEKMLFTVEKYGNTSAASIPLTLYVHADKIKPGQLVFMGTFGGGFQWGALLVRWGGTNPALLTSLTPEFFHAIDEAI